MEDDLDILLDINLPQTVDWLIEQMRETHPEWIRKDFDIWSC